MKKYEEVEHTADLALRVFGRSFPELLAHAGEGLFSLVGEASFSEAELRTIRFEVAGETEADVLHAFLRELLRRFDLEAFFPVTIAVSGESAPYRVEARGGSFDPGRHVFFTEIKGITHHGLNVSRHTSHWEAEVVVDV